MAKANQKYPDTTTPKQRQERFDKRRKHNHYPQGKTGYVPRGN